jgi:hypothetical protein
MKVRNIGTELGTAVDHIAEPVGWLGAVVAFLILGYLLTAPPIILAHARETGSGSFPAVYGPVLMLIESDFGGPMIWYFNSIWGAELVFIGGDGGVPWYVTALYAVVGAAFLTVLLFPFWKTWRSLPLRGTAKLGTCVKLSRFEHLSEGRKCFWQKKFSDVRNAPEWSGMARNG